MNIQPNVKNVQPYPNNPNFKNPAINYLCSNFFIKTFPAMVFLKNYFKYFSHEHYLHNAKLTQNNFHLEKLYFLIKGSIKYEFIGSVISMHNIIKYIIEAIKKRNREIPDKQIEQMKKEYLNDPEILRIKNKDDYIKNEFNKIQSFDLFIANEGEIIGVEEFYINVPYLTNCYVISEQTEVFKITKNDFKSFLKHETELKWKFEEMAFRKVISFIKRIHNIKRSLIKMILFKNNKFNQTAFTNLHMKLPGRNTFINIEDNSFRNKMKCMSLSQDIDLNTNNNTLYVSDDHSKANTTYKNYFSSSLLAHSKRTTYSKELLPSKNTSEQFLETKPNKLMTVIKLKNGHVTLDNIENKVYKINQQYLLFQKSPNKCNQSCKDNNSNDEVTLLPNQCASSSHLSFVDLSNAKESLFSSGNKDCSNEKQIKHLPELKTSFSATHSKVFRNKWHAKHKDINQDDINIKINNKFIEHFISNNSVKYHSVVQRIKSFYKTKQLKGYCSMVNLENNKYRNISIKKSNNKIFKHNIFKRLKLSSLEHPVQSNLRSISQDI